jgi:hypothetical protein
VFLEAEKQVMPISKVIMVSALLCILGVAGCGALGPLPPRPELSLDDPPGTPVGAPAWFKPDKEYSPWPLGDEPKYGTEEWRRWCAVRYHSRDLVREMTQPPTVDGSLTEPVWQRTAVKQAFVDTYGKPATPGTQFSIAYDSENIYIAGRVDEPSTKKLRATRRERDLPMIGDDHVEINLAPAWTTARPGVYRVLVNSAGTISDALASDSAWSPKIKVAASVGLKFWSFEMVIPLSAMDIPRGTDLHGEVWACRVLRWRHAGGTGEVSSWTRLTDPNAGASHWGHVMFKGPKPKAKTPEPPAKKGGTETEPKDKERKG